MTTVILCLPPKSKQWSWRKFVVIIPNAFATTKISVPDSMTRQTESLVASIAIPKWNNQLSYLFSGSLSPIWGVGQCWSECKPTWIPFSWLRQCATRTTQLFYLTHWISLCAIWWRTKMMKSGNIDISVAPLYNICSSYIYSVSEILDTIWTILWLL